MLKVTQARYSFHPLFAASFLCCLGSGTPCRDNWPVPEILKEQPSMCAQHLPAPRAWLALRAIHERGFLWQMRKLRHGKVICPKSHSQ